MEGESGIKAFSELNEGEKDKINGGVDEGATLKQLLIINGTGHRSEHVRAFTNRQSSSISIN